MELPPSRHPSLTPTHPRTPPRLQLATLTAHDMRVLYLALSPDGQTIVTGAGDETLRFWNVFPSVKPSSAASPTGLGGVLRTHIR